MTEFSFRPEVKERFTVKVDSSSGPDGCWNWTASKTPRGYGHFSIDGRLIYAHRYSYVMTNPDADITGMKIDHQCHNPSCVNPAHLRLVTHKQNLEHRSGPRPGSRSGVRGVCWNKQKNKWMAVVVQNGKNVYAGFFDNIPEAAEAARLKRLELFTHSDMDRTG